VREGDVKRALRAIERELAELEGVVEEMKPLRPSGQAVGAGNPLVSMMKIAIKATHNVQVLLTPEGEDDPPKPPAPKADPLDTPPPGVPLEKWLAVPKENRKKILALRATMLSLTAKKG